jgi:DinB superfamily
VTGAARLGDVTEGERSPAQYAADIDGARDRFIAFVAACTAEQWNAAPLKGDPRPVGVVADHVAHAYEYLSGWMRQLLRGETVTVNSDVVDALNAEHAAAAMGVTRAQAAGHLRRSGAAISALVASCTAGDLKAGDGRVERLAQIAIRHPDTHRTEIEAAFADRKSER